MSLLSSRGSSLNEILSVGKKPANRRNLRHRRESLTDYTAQREKALEKSFWDGVFGIVGIRNFSETDYAETENSKHETESPEQLIKVVIEFFAIVNLQRFSCLIGNIILF